MPTNASTDVPNLSDRIDKSWINAHRGSGSFGDVYQGTLVTVNGLGGTSIPVAIKKLRYFTHWQEPKKQEKIRKRMERELKILNKLDHPNVIKLLGKIVHEEIEVYSMVFPWMDRGDLEQCLPMIRERRVSFSGCLKILRDISAGLKYLHMQDKPIIHGDLSSGNILFDSEGRAYLSDFGMATVLTDRQTYQTTTQCENYRWCAPEYYSILEGGPKNLNPTCEADVYSFGSIMFAVLSGKKPYHNIDPNSLIKHVVIDGKVPTRDHSIEKTQWEMIKKCWNKDPKKRPKISEVAAKIQEWYAEAVKDSPDDHPESNDLWDSDDPSDPGSMFPNPRTMFILNFPPGTTHTDLFNFLHRHHTLQMLSWQDRGSLVSSPTFCCPRCPKSLCMSSCKQSAFALYDDEEHLREALNNISSKKWDADEPKSPSLICSPRKNEDKVKNGTAVYIQWAQNSVVPEFIPYRPTRTFLMRALKTEPLLDSSHQNDMWRTLPHIEDILNQAYATSVDVHLVFCMKEAKEIFGIARMEEAIPGKLHTEDQPTRREEKTPARGRSFRIRWLNHPSTPLPFQARAVKDRKISPYIGKIKDGRDGTELPSDCANDLLAVWGTSRTRE